MFLKANFTSEGTTRCFSLLLLICLAGCGSYESSENRDSSPAAAATGLQNSFNPPGQLIADDTVHSIQLYKGECPEQAPFLELGSNDRLQLRFETIGFESRSFRVRFTHHNPDWSRSGLGEEQFLDGFTTLYVNGGRPGINRQPSYRQFSFSFPDETISFRRSGNYMIRVEDADSGHLVFSLPFFVYENIGEIRSRADREGVRAGTLRSRHRMVSRYELPDEVDQPRFDLSFYFVQNRFWGRMQEASETDFSAPDHVQFETGTGDSFTGDYEFRWLDLSQFTQTHPSVDDIDPGTTPPRILLREDTGGFHNPPPHGLNGRYALPDTDPQAGYADVTFRFDAEQNVPDQADIYLLGDFNHWTPRSGYRMTFNTESQRWETTVSLKQGHYHYKYVLMENHQLDDLYFDALFADTPQEYHALVYMHDSRNFYHRLLQINHFFQRP